MAPESSDRFETPISQSDGVTVERISDGSNEGRNKTTRHPRWSRQETIVLIQGKNVIESRGRMSRGSTSGAGGSDRIEPKWDAISSYCRQHGVTRGAAQCRKRWSNLICDFKKIKAWEAQITEEVESFWVMRNDLRKEKKLPGFFDREVFDVLSGKEVPIRAIPLAQYPAPTEMENADGDDTDTETTEDELGDEDEVAYQVVFNTNVRPMSGENLFYGFQQPRQGETGKRHEKETAAATGTPRKTTDNQFPMSGKVKDKRPSSSEWTGSMTQERLKRTRLSENTCEDTNLENRLIKVLERNGNLLNDQLRVHNVNCQLDREQRKEQNDNLLAAVNRLTDALVRIADK